MNNIKKFFNGYSRSRENFNTFHNQVINMPRENFNKINLSLLKSMAYYLICTHESIIVNGNLKNIKLTYKELLLNMSKSGYNLKKTKITVVDEEFEKVFLDGFSNIDNHYKNVGRRFRHLMGLCLLFGLIESEGKSYVTINYNKCQQYVYTPIELELELMRNEVININISSNPFIQRLRGINLNKSADYSLALGIITYIYNINRPVTDFEISVLLGRIDERQSFDEILKRALIIGNDFTSKRYLSRESQVEYFFKEMNWVNSDGSLYKYVTSQEPWFKFKTFIKLLTNFNLLDYDYINDTYEITSYSKRILSSSIPSYLVDLETLLDKLEDKTYGDAKIKSLIIDSRKSDILNVIKESDKEKLITSIGKRSLGIIDEYDDIETSKVHNKKRRNSLVMMLAKLLKNDTCDIVYTFDENGNWAPQFNKKLFLNKNGRAYCEGHHLIEFNNEDGPDIIENIILVDPNTHKIIHEGNETVKREMYAALRQKKIITLELFKSMITRYNCLNSSHIENLYTKGIIASFEAQELLKLIND